MATQSELLNFIKSNYEYTEVSDTLLRLEFFIDGGKSSQIVFAGIQEDLVIVSSPFANKDMLTPVQAINAVRDSFLGLQVYGELYVLTNSFPLEDIDASEIDWALKVVAVQADMVEQSSVGGDSY